MAGWSSWIARLAHNQKVGGSSPPPATGRELHAPDRIVAYAEREAKVAAKEADRLARSGSQQAIVPDTDTQNSEAAKEINHE